LGVNPDVARGQWMSFQCENVHFPVEYVVCYRFDKNEHKKTHPKKCVLVKYVFPKANCVLMIGMANDLC